MFLFCSHKKRKRQTRTARPDRLRPIPVEENGALLFWEHLFAAKPDGYWPRTVSGSHLKKQVAMTDNWTAKVEYLAVGFEHASCGLGNCLAVPAVSVSFFESMVRAGINYKF
jgi:hypothetical protein